MNTFLVLALAAGLAGIAILTFRYMWHELTDLLHEADDAIAAVWEDD